jgi:PAS domain S-box-containing protein
VVGLHYSDVVHPDDWSAAHARMTELMVGDISRVRHDERYVRPDGEVRWVAVVTSRINDRGVTTGTALHRVVDITARRRAELERDQAAATLAEAQAIAHFGSWEYDFATQETTCSAELLRIFGLDPTMTPPDVTSLFEWIHLDDRKAVREAAWASFETGTPFAIGCRINRADGSERIVHVQGRFSTDLAGHDRVVGTLQDVTDQRRAEARVRESEERVRAVFENAPLGIATIDASLRMLNVNVALADMLGENPERLVGRTVVEITHPDDVALARDLARQTMAGEIPGYDIEKRLLRRDRGVVWVRVRVALLSEAAGRTRSGFVLVEDITARREVERAWRELDSLRQTLLGRLSAQERRVLEHMAAGQTNRQIAQELVLAEKTVSNYVSHLLTKLGMHRRSEAAAFAARLEEQGHRPRYTY